ncbi:hypothetical protein BDV26DRAFT_291000 [Aspergillus bertholletiae]|uniref:Uncharacterized protein n=1 Tax=Aspergillus bertholletiae TaxID=1226010 RepID=A0A5N7BDJ3_9EURO|nr:hypothetical protein BDV26DRAFT_291000 [Aspergillus bertholletiae]
MEELTSKQARQFVDEIARRNGSITDEDRAATPPAVLQALQNVRNRLGNQQFPWTPCDDPDIQRDVRRDVIFRLISSARSLHYNWATRHGQEPYFSLDVSEDHIVIDTNDDGCQKSDIVCLSEAIAFPSNTRASRLYGSVLLYTARIAGEAHVQSGPFSFSLGPLSRSDGLRFATPVNKNPALLPGGVNTRIILYPVLPGGFDKLVDEFQVIADDGFVLLDPEDARRPMCKKFVLIARRQDFKITNLVYKFQLRDNILNVTKRHPLCFSFASPTERFLLYQPSIPSSFGRQMALLFPIDLDTTPVLQPRKAYHIIGSFAFPISVVPFNFIICATVTEREPVRDADIDSSTLIHNWVIDSFCGAVSFCQNHSMAYAWVQYIPKQRIASPAWQKTIQELIGKLQVAPVFQSHKGVLQSLSSLRYLSPKHYGGDNKPLFEASDDEHYLSTKYHAYLDYLKSLGLQEFSDYEVLERFEPILTDRLRIVSRCNLQNEQMSSILRQLILWLTRVRNDPLATEIRKIPLIQLNNGSFVRGNDLHTVGSKADLTVYLPTDIHGNDIPKCLDILMVSEEAVRDNVREQLFRLLGVRCMSPQLVMERISHRSHSTHTILGTEKSVIDSMYILSYVYDQCTRDDRLQIPCLLTFDTHYQAKVVCQNSCPWYIASDVYLGTDGAYGTKAIATLLGSTSIFSALPSVPFLLHPILLQPNLIRKMYISNDRWKAWLINQRIARQVPRLKHWNSPKELSDLFDAIISRHPDTFLSILERYWDTYKIEIRKEPLLASAIKAVKVPTLNGLARLDECWFPIPEICSMVEAVSFPLNMNFLNLPGSWDLDSKKKWKFLLELGVSGDGATTFVKLFKDLLLCTTTLEDAKPHFFEVYNWLSERPFEDLWQSFDDETAVYIPDIGDGAELVHLDQCVWNGPSWLRTMHALALHEEYANDSKIRGLFLDTLNVQNADWGTYMTELIHLQDVGVSSSLETQRIYQAIMEDAEDDDWESLRSQFQQYKMVYVPSLTQWYAPGQCIWASFTISSKIGISTIYPDMGRFFVEKLQIQPPSILCYTSHIRDLCKQGGSVDEVIGALCHINNLKPTISDLSYLKDIDFLPIEGTKEDLWWGSVTSDFFIIDREGWPTLFYGEVPTLHLRLEEVRTLTPLLKSLGLENRFISTCATRKTSVTEMPSQSSLHLTTNFRQRSSGLYRCVTHYRGGNAGAFREVYNTFRKALVYETDDIVGECTLTSPRGVGTTLQTYSRLHMEFVNGTLSIFVPRDEKERLICYATQLPETLMASLDIKDPTAYGTVTTILQVPVEVVDGILGTHGIPEVFDLDPISPVATEDSEADYKSAPEEVFVPKASIAWGDKDQVPASEESELALRSKQTRQPPG